MGKVEGQNDRVVVECLFGGESDQFGSRRLGKDFGTSSEVEDDRCDEWSQYDQDYAVDQ